MPSAASQCGSGPITGLNSQAQVRPERKVGTAQGTKTRAWTSRRPRNWRLSSRARPKPSRNWKASEPPVHHSGVDQRPPEIAVGDELAEMRQPDPAAVAGIEQLDVAEGVGQPDDDRHEHHQPEQHQPGRQEDVGLDRVEQRVGAAAQGGRADAADYCSAWPAISSGRRSGTSPTGWRPPRRSSCRAAPPAPSGPTARRRNSRAPRDGPASRSARSADR